jgi:hypothetical protein
MNRPSKVPQSAAAQRTAGSYRSRLQLAWVLPNNSPPSGFPGGGFSFFPEIALQTFFVISALQNI